MTYMKENIFKFFKDFQISGLAIAIVSFIIYLATLAPGVFGFDSAELATGVYIGGIVHPTGYPLYMLVGKLFSFLPIGDLAFRLNLMSAIFASLAIWVIFEIIYIFGKNKWVAAFSAMILAISNYFWQLALVAEVYTLHIFLLAINILLLLKWQKSGNYKFLAGFVFCYSLSLTNHTSGILFAPGFAYIILTSKYWKWKLSRQNLLLAGLFILGLLPYLYLPLRALANPSLNYINSYYDIDLTSLNGIWWMISGRAYRFFAFGYNWTEGIREIGKYSGFLTRNFLGVGLLFGVFGIHWFWKRYRAFLFCFGLIFTGNVIFFSNYQVLDKDTMFLPSYLVWAIMISGGLISLIELIHKYKWKTNVKSLNLGLGFVLTLVLASGIFLNWRWVDLSEMTSPSIFVDEVFETASLNSTIIADWSSAVVLEYSQIVEGERKDLKIINHSRLKVAEYYRLWETGLARNKILKLLEKDDVLLIQENLSSGMVYIIEYDPVLAKEFEYLPEGSFFQLTLKP